MKTHPIIYALILLFAAGCGTIDPAGVYQGDKTLYTTDLTIVTPYSVLHSFVAWELKYRSLLAHKPEIKRAADKIRNQAPAWFQEAVRLRDIFADTPNETNKSAFTKALGIINAAVIEAIKIMGDNASVTTATVKPINKTENFYPITATTKPVISAMVLEDMNGEQPTNAIIRRNYLWTH